MLRHCAGARAQYGGDLEKGKPCLLPRICPRPSRNEPSPEPVPRSSRDPPPLRAYSPSGTVAPLLGLLAWNLLSVQKLIPPLRSSVAAKPCPPSMTGASFWALFPPCKLFALRRYRTLCLFVEPETYQVNAAFEVLPNVLGEREIVAQKSVFHSVRDVHRSFGDGLVRRVLRQRNEFRNSDASALVVVLENLHI